MSTAVKTQKKGLGRSLTLPKRSKDVEKPIEEPASPTAVPRDVTDVLIVGGIPRVHLLPPQVLARKKAKTLRRRLGFGVIGVVVLVVLGVVLAMVSTATAQASLLAAQSQTAGLLQQQAKYGDVLKVKADIASIQAAQKQATAQEILWQPYFSDIQATLPAGASITTISAAIDSPFQTPVVNDVPLEGPRIATVNASLSMPQQSIASWLNTLPTLKGYVDATPNSVSAGDAGNYTVSVTLHINSDALADRFTKAAGTKK